MFFFTFLIGLVMGVSMLVNAAPFFEDDVELESLDTTDSGLGSRAIGRRGYDPSYDWHESKGAMQVWMGSQGVNIGDMTGSDLYGTIWQALERMCPSSTKENLCGLGREASFNSICMVGRPPKPEDCKIKIKAMDFHWENEEIHKLLIGAAAGALEAATMEDDYGNLNCHTILGHGKGCNVGNAIRVNMPDIPNKGDGWEKHNGLTFWLENVKKGWDHYWCCEKLQNIDTKSDGLKDEILKAFPRWKKAWVRESRCIINGWATCPT